jgi:hypothetical protein
MAGAPARSSRAATIALLILGPIAAACREGGGEAGMESASRDDTTAWSGRMVFELAQLEESLTHREWMRTHPDDGVGEAPVGGRGCEERRGSWTFPGNVKLERLADFYVPEPPETLPALPPSRDSALARCLLGRIGMRLTLGDPEMTYSRAAADSLRLAIERRHGPGTTDSSHPRLGLESRWQIGPSVLTVRYQQGLQPVVEASLPAVPRFGPPASSGIPLEALGYFVRASGTDSSQAAVPLAILRRAAESGELRGSRTERRIADALAPWLDSAAAYDPTRRAAALIVADALLAYLECDIQRGPPAIRGARFLWQREAGEGVEEHCLYTNNWLAEALALDSLQAFGDSGRAMLLVSGLARGGGYGCGLGEWVVSEGERLLQTVSDRPLLAELHFMLGDALDESGRGERHANLEAPLAHYRAGLALDNTSSRAREAWFRAWSILVTGRRTGPRPDLVWC